MRWIMKYAELVQTTFPSLHSTDHSDLYWYASLSPALSDQCQVFFISESVTRFRSLPWSTCWELHKATLVRVGCNPCRTTYAAGTLPCAPQAFTHRAKSREDSEEQAQLLVWCVVSYWLVCVCLSVNTGSIPEGGRDRDRSFAVH